MSPEPLDLVLYNRSRDPYGAHPGVWMADDEILHLCAELGRPTVWVSAEFERRTRYYHRIGYKRVLGLPPVDATTGTASFGTDLEPARRP